MFSEKDTKNTTATGDFNVLSNGTTIKGEISSESSFRIDGRVEGPVKVKNRLVLGEKGVMIGDINCAVADVSGKIRGKVFCAQELILRKTAVLECEITTKVLTVEPGAKIEGTCTMNMPGQQNDSKPAASK